MSVKVINEIIAKLQEVRDTKVVGPSGLEKMIHKNLSDMMQDIIQQVRKIVHDECQQIKQDLRKGFESVVEDSQYNNPKISIEPLNGKSKNNATQNQPSVSELNAAQTSKNITPPLLPKPPINPPSINTANQKPKLCDPPSPEIRTKYLTRPNSNQSHQQDLSLTAEESQSRDVPPKIAVKSPMDLLREEMIQELTHLKEVMRGGRPK